MFGGVNSNPFANGFAISFVIHPTASRSAEFTFMCKTILAVLPLVEFSAAFDFVALVALLGLQ
jgi:hypothetical protein